MNCRAPAIGFCILCLISRSPRANAQSNASLASLTVALAPTVGNGITAAAWQSTHPGSKLISYSPLRQMPNESCAQSTTTIRLLDSTKATVEVTFYTPDVPDAFTLPAASPNLVRRCRAGMLWITIHDRDTALIDRRRDATDAALTPLMGAAEPAAKLSWYGSASWLQPTLRETSTVSLVVAAEHANKSLRGDSTHVFAAMIARRLGFSMRDTEFMAREFLADTQSMHAGRRRTGEMLLIAEPPAPQREEMEKFRAILESPSGDPPHFSSPQIDAFGDAMEHWLAMAKTLSPPRHAAALIVARDVFMEAGYSAGWGEPEDSLFRKRMTSLGAVFVDDPLGGGYDFDESWITEAWHIAPTSKAGETAFLMAMDFGFETNGTCSTQEGNGFRAVIREGERFIREHPTSAILSQVHLGVAQAWGDVVTLAAGGGYLAEEDSTEALKYRPEAAHARQRAIAEYRIAIATLQDAAQRKAAWVDAWRLLAGLPAASMRYNCIYD